MTGSRRGTHKGRCAALLTAAVAVSLAAAGCTTGPGTEDDGRASNAPQPERSHSAAPASGPVLAVKVDNVRAARPQTGLEDADVVYAEPVEAGLSRLMAIYATKLPESVGPVRSARESDLELLGQFDQPVLAFSGAQSKLLPLIDKAPLRAEPADEDSAAYVRDPNRQAPHNLYLRPAELLRKPSGAAALTTGFTYGKAPAGGRAESSHTVRYPSASFTFTWSDSRDRWLVTMDGSPARTTDGGRLAPATVVVQHVTVRESAFRDFRSSKSPYVESVGSGHAEVLRDGRAYEATWKRGAAEDGTTFTTEDGKPLNFAEGQVWVVFAGRS
ncbi:DUF3048 domain-containing protein [Streptomyces sp. KPB2]|uniref:DUF3048 domain-containing protein n=1 Tax=Streptomyces sp. KPB2 TaxID=2305221 RepID=UPI000F6E22CD|nr:DUF3048 domain-containing protein [Streptomyces sp. KPB2]AZM74344.1 DUF3048 domain-containing protein [Streptomyces sp. KPB2]